VTGIDNEESQHFQTYPNPTTSTIIILNGSNVRHVSIRNAHGQLISSVHNEGDSAKVSLEHMPAGIYLIELIDQRGTTTIRRVVKK
jgi:hypothetical protein